MMARHVRMKSQDGLVKARRPICGSLIAGLLCLACASGQAKAPTLAPEISRDDAAVVYGSRPSLPTTTGRYELVELTFDDPDFSAFGRCLSPDGVRVVAYLYPIPGPDAWCLADCAVSWVHGEADEFVAETIPEFLRVGYMSEMVLTSDSLVHSSRAGSTVGRHLVFEVTDPDGAPAPSFFRSLIGDVSPAYRCLVGSAGAEQTVQIESTVAAPIEVVGPVIDSVLIAIGYEPKSRRGAWTSVPRYRPQQFARRNRRATRCPLHCRP